MKDLEKVYRTKINCAEARAKKLAYKDARKMAQKAILWMSKAFSAGAEEVILETNPVATCCSMRWKIRGREEKAFLRKKRRFKTPQEEELFAGTFRQRFKDEVKLVFNSTVAKVTRQQFLDGLAVHRNWP